jgi:hypothetical protein
MISINGKKMQAQTTNVCLIEGSSWATTKIEKIIMAPFTNCEHKSQETNAKLKSHLCHLG